MGVSGTISTGHSDSDNAVNRVERSHGRHKSMVRSFAFKSKPPEVKIAEAVQDNPAAPRSAGQTILRA